MTRHRRERSRLNGPRARALLAALAALLVALSFAVLVADRQPRARARETDTTTDTGLGTLAAQVQASIGQQRLRTAERSGVDHHAASTPDQAPPAGQGPAIRDADRLVRRWLNVYLPYEVGHLGADVRRELKATSTTSLARALLAHPPVVPPPQQHSPPPQGLPTGLTTVMAPGGRSAQVYVAVSYGLEREGFHLTLTKGASGWLVAAFHG